VLRPTAEADFADSSACASFPLVPWSNRIKDATFGFGGRTYTLRANSSDRTAMHGVGRDYPWQVRAADPAQLALKLDTADIGPEGVNFPWPFRARIVYRLDGERFSIEMALRNTGDEPFPAGFGQHPYFMRTLSGPQDRAELEIPCAQQFPAENCIPYGPPQPIHPRLDFRRLRTLEQVFIDDNLTGRTPGRPVLIVYPRSNVALSMRMDPIFENIILYSPLRKPYFAVEPVTNANNGFNLLADGVPGSGVVVLEPGQSARGTITLELVRL
jgi:aldose 1-epimerase